MPAQRQTTHFSIREAAALYSVSSDTIRRRIADGSIPAVRIGRLIRIPVDALDAAFRPIPTGGGSEA